MMKTVTILLGFALTLSTTSAEAQMAEKDTYTAEQNGKPQSPAAALDTMLSMFEAQAVQAAEAMPANRYDFSPSATTFAPGQNAKFTGVRTFAGQVAHLAQANYFFYASLNGAKPPVDVKAIGTMKGKDELVAALKQSFTFAHAQIATITPANAFSGITGGDGMHTLVTLAAFGVAHGYDHYGQMVEYLRMNGVVPVGSK